MKFFFFEKYDTQAIQRTFSRKVSPRIHKDNQDENTTTEFAFLILQFLKNNFAKNDLIFFQGKKCKKRIFSKCHKVQINHTGVDLW